MKSPEKRWADEHTRQFEEHYSRMRGYVRRELTRENIDSELHEFLSFPRNAADIGGGVGYDARWLAHTYPNSAVTLIDPTPAAIEAAKDVNYPVLENIILGDSGTALDRFGPESFDLVLSHGVLLYQDNPNEELTRIASLIKPRGYLSLLTAGLYGKRERFERQGRSAAARLLESTGVYRNDLDIRAHAYLPQDLEAMLELAGLETQQWFGVRTNPSDDNSPLADIPAFHRNRRLDEELRASRDPARKANGQLLHFIARKRA